MMNIISVSFLFLSLAAIVSGEKCAQSMKNSRTKLFCYYSKLKDVNSCKCTHVILPANSDVKSIENLRSNLNGVKILVTVHEFNEGLVDLLKKTKVDGLEVDLKKLTSKDDIADFISTARIKLGSDLYTAVSVPVKNELLAKYYDFKGLTKHVDSFILETAFLGASNNVTFHPSRLSGLWDMQNADSVVDLVTGLGAPISKLVIAAPVQGFQFKLQDEKHTAPGSPALEIKSISREDLCKTMTASNWTLERDQDQAGPYIFRKNQWIAFDDPMSVDIKAKYVRVRGLAGLALKDLSQDGGSDCGGLLLEAAFNGLSKQSRAPRGAVLQSLEREILTASPTSHNIQVSPYRITRIIDTEGKIHAVRQDTRTEFECSRQGYFVHPRSCNRFYRCVKFNQLTDEFNVFEFDCPAGLAFDSRVEVCVWPGSLSDGSACSGSSEIAPVPKERFVCPHEAGYYADPENCRWFFACLDHGQDVMTAYEFRCPFGLVFDQDRLVCEWPWLVPRCASGYASSGVLVEFHGGAYGTHGGVVGVNGVVNPDDGGERTGYRLRGAYIKPQQGIVLENYNGLGALQPVALGGLHGPISEPISKVYSSFGHGSGEGYAGNGAVIGIQDGHQNLAGQGVLVGTHDGIGAGYVNDDQSNILAGIGSSAHQRTGSQAVLAGIGGEYDGANAKAAQGNVLIGIGGVADANIQHSGGNAAEGVLVGVQNGGIGGEYANGHHGNDFVGIDNLGHDLASASVHEGGNAGQAVLVGVQHGQNGASYANAAHGNVLVGVDNLEHRLAGNAGQAVLEGGIAENNLLVGVGGSDNVGHGLTGAGIHHGSYIAGLDQGAGSRGSYVGADLNQGQIDSLNRGTIRFNAGLGNDAGKSVNQVTYHGNLGSSHNIGGQSSGDSRYTEGERILSSIQDGGSIYGGNHLRGSARYQGSGELGGGQSTVTYHGNFGKVANNAEGQSLVGGDTHGDHRDSIALVQDVQNGGFHQEGYSINSPADRASIVFGAKLRGSQEGGEGAVFTGEKFVSNYIQNGHDQIDGSKLGLDNQVLIGEQNLGVQDGVAKTTVTYHGNRGSSNIGVDHGAIRLDSGNVGDQNYASKFELANQGLIGEQNLGVQDGIAKTTVTYHGNRGSSNIGVDHGAIRLASGSVGDQNYASKFELANQGLIGEQNLGVQDGVAKTTVTYHGNTGSSNIGVDHGAIRLDSGNVGDQNYASKFELANQGLIGEQNLGVQDGAAKTTVTYHGNTGSSNIGVDHGAIRLDSGNVGIVTHGNQDFSQVEGGSLQYNLDGAQGNLGGGRDSSSRSYQNFNSGKVNIVKGGFSAVGVYPNTYKQSTPSISTITASPIPVTASPIPVVTSVPIPTTHINDNLDVYNGNGVVANVPELQVKVETPSAVIPNIQRTHTASTGAILEVGNGGYVYDKPAVAFVEGGDSKFVGQSRAKSYAHQNIEHRQPFLTDITPSVPVQPVSVNLPQQTETTSYHIGQTSTIHHAPQPSLDYEDQKVLVQPQIAIKQNVIGSADISGHSGGSYTYQNLGKSTIANTVTPSILVEQKIAEPTPTISSVHFGTALIDHPNPAIVVQPAVESVSTIRPVLVNTPSVGVQPIRPASPVILENVTPYSGPIEIGTMRPQQHHVVQQSSFNYEGAHPVQNVEINKEVGVGFGENVTPIPQGVRGGSSYFYERNDFAKSTPTLPSASFNFQSLPARGFEKQVDVVENVTPTPILVQHEVKRPISVVIGDNSQANFLSSVAKSRGFSKFSQNIEQTPYVPVTPVVNIAQPIIPESGGDINLELKHRSRGFAKFTPTILEATTPHAIAQNEHSFGTFSYDGFGVKTQQIPASGYYETHHERTGYHYPKPQIQFEEGHPIVDQQDYAGLEPVKEEPFVLKKAYITGNTYKSVTPAPIFVTSTINPTYQSTIQSVYNTIPSTTVKPANFYYYDNRLSSTPKPYEFKPSITVTTPRIAVTTPKPIPAKFPVTIDYDLGTRSTVGPTIITESKPIFKYSFSSFDSQYATTPAPSIVSTYQPVAIKSTTVRPILDVTVPSRAYLPVHNVIENYQSPIFKGRKIIQPSSQAIIKVNDFHPLLSAKLGAQCTCIADSVRFRNKPVKVSIDDGETVEEFVVKPNNQPDLLGFSEGESIKDAYINAVPDYESQKVIDITPLPEVTIGSTIAAPISRGPVIVRKRLRVRPIQPTTIAPVSKLPDVFLTSTAVPAYKEASQQVAQNFDRYGPGGLRSRTETLQGTVDCQRAGLFRHPTQCNKFYSCRWDCTKNKFTLHVFNCPVHLTFDDSLGACNWPSQGPACLGNTLLPSD